MLDSTKLYRILPGLQSIEIYSTRDISEFNSLPRDQETL